MLVPEGEGEVLARAATREARDCGAMVSTGTRCPGKPWEGFAARTERTSVWDWRVIRTDSAEVMHPLHSWSFHQVKVSPREEKLARETGRHLHARQSFRLISAVWSF